VAHYSSMSCILYPDWSRNPGWLAYVLCYAFKVFVFNINIKAVEKRIFFYLNGMEFQIDCVDWSGGEPKFKKISRF